MEIKQYSPKEQLVKEEVKGKTKKFLKIKVQTQYRNLWKTATKAKNKINIPSRQLISML